MNGVGWGGVLFIWLSFLWPIIVSVVVCFLIKKSKGTSKYWLISIFGGYFSVWLIGSTFKVITLPDLQSNSSIFENIVFVVFGVSLVAPVLVSLYASKKYS